MKKLFPYYLCKRLCGILRSLLSFNSRTTGNSYYIPKTEAPVSWRVIYIRLFHNYIHLFSSLRTVRPLRVTEFSLPLMKKWLLFARDISLQNKYASLFTNYYFHIMETKIFYMYIKFFHSSFETLTNIAIIGKAKRFWHVGYDFIEHWPHSAFITFETMMCRPVFVAKSGSACKDGAWGATYRVTYQVFYIDIDLRFEPSTLPTPTERFSSRLMEDPVTAWNRIHPPIDNEGHAISIVVSKLGAL